MPRDGSGVASAVPGSDSVAPNTTILSALHNSMVQDIYQLFNTAWPVAFGGSGAISASNFADLNNSTSILAALLKDIGGAVTAGGTATAITATLNRAYTAYGASAGQIANGTLLSLKMLLAATGAATITLSAPSALAGKAIRRQGDTAIQANDWLVNATVKLRYDTAYNAAAGAWVLLNPSGLAADNVALPPGSIFGLTTSNNATDAVNDIDIAPGSARDSTNVDNIVLASSITKRLDAAWAAGTGNGGLDTGSIADAGYHIWLIKRPDTGVVDVLFSTSATAPTMPANYTLKRRIASFVRNSASIRAYVQDGDRFMLKVPSNDVSAANPGTSAVTRALLVPAGLRVLVHLGVTGQGQVAPGAIYISDLSATDTGAGPTTAFTNYSYNNGATINAAGAQVSVFTNTSGQIRSRIEVSDATVTLRIMTLGWSDTRGKDA